MLQGHLDLPLFRLKRIRLHGLDLSTKHVVIDSREPEMKKAAHLRSPVDLSEIKSLLFMCL
ncbi:hypothetical protein D4T06_04075 [Salmonella enterica]|nr:hypothetical protein [Salmonella enterica]EBI3980191.1 hypothetical protein [Salmonella enterica]